MCLRINQVIFYSYHLEKLVGYKIQIIQKDSYYTANKLKHGAGRNRKLNSLIALPKFRGWHE